LWICEGTYNQRNRYVALQYIVIVVCPARVEYYASTSTGRKGDVYNTIYFSQMLSLLMRVRFQ
jgi:hypothetical protein